MFWKDKDLFETIAEHEVILSKELKKIRNYGKDGNKGFETVITRLQMQSYVCAADFVYMQDKSGKPYGWGVAQYTTPEHLFGYEYVASVYKMDPSISKQKITDHLKQIFPDVNPKTIEKLTAIS